MGIKETIIKLQSIDAKDLKNIDFGQVKNNIKSKPDILLIIVLITASLSATIYMYTDYKKKTKEFEEKKITYDDQLNAAKQNEIIKAKYDKFLNEFPDKIIIDQMIEKLSTYAFNYNINIISFSPATKIEDEYSKTESININVNAEDYEELIGFIDEIENAPYAIRIETWSANIGKTAAHTSNRRSRRSADTSQTSDENPIIAATIEIAAITLIE